jgi:hypothetical protein
LRSYHAINRAGKERQHRCCGADPERSVDGQRGCCQPRRHSAQRNIDAPCGEAVDLAIVDDQSLAGKKTDAVEPVPKVIDVEAAKRDLVI